MDTLEELIARAKKNEEIARNLFDIEVSILNITSTQVFLEHLIKAVCEKFSINMAWYSVIDSPYTKDIRTALSQSEQLKGDWIISSPIDYLGCTKGTRQPLLAHKHLGRFGHLVPASLRDELGSIAILPLILEGRIAGSLNLADESPARYQADKDAFFLHQLCVKASLCLSTVVSREKVAFLATRDPLTHLRNRRELDETLTKELSRVTRHGQPLGLVFIDCDDFKLVNDRYGHDVGDEYLKHVANLLVRWLRETDLVFRFAGDEFVVLLPNQDEIGVQKSAERITEFLEKNTYNKDGIQIPVEVSMGCTSTTELVELSSRSLLKQADIGLYEIKRQKKQSIVDVTIN